MAHKQEDASPFTGFGIGAFAKSQDEGGVFILAVYRDGALTAAAYATERGAMEAAVESLEDEQDEDDEGGALEDRFARARRFVADEGGIMEVIASPVSGG